MAGLPAVPSFFTSGLPCLGRMFTELIFPDLIGYLGIGAGVVIHALRQNGKNFVRPLMGRIGALRGEQLPPGRRLIDQHAGTQQVVMLTLLRTDLPEELGIQSLMDGCPPDIINGKMAEDTRLDLAVGIDMKILAPAG